MNHESTPGALRLPGTQTTLSRRTLLATASAGAVALTAGCSNSEAPPGTQPTSTAAVALPTYHPFDGPKADLPGDAVAGVPDAFLSYPADPPTTGRVPVGVSAPFGVLTQGAPTAAGMANNPWWQQWNTDVGVEIDYASVTSTEYTAKFQTLVAGNMLSDVTQIDHVARLPELLDERFTNLTPYLAGDKVAKYPNLANLPPASWTSAMIGGQLWGVPQPRIPGGTVLVTNGDILDARGIDAVPSPTSGDDFLSMCREVNDPANNVFAFGHSPTSWTMPLIMEALGGPNRWRVEGDTWVSDYESPEYERALEIVAGMWAEGLFHPNSYSDLSSTAIWFRAGTTVLQSTGFANWQGAAVAYDFDCGVAAMPVWEGTGAAAKHLGAPAYALPVGLKKTDDEARIDDLLRFFDYVASPFGTVEFLRVNYGVEGRQWKLSDGDLALIKGAPDEALKGLKYAGSPVGATIYVPGQPEVAKRIHQWCADHIPGGVQNPSVGLFSETNLSKAPIARKRVEDTVGAIIQGRAQLSEWPAAVKRWKDSAADEMAREYAAAAAAAA